MTVSHFACNVPSELKRVVTTAERNFPSCVQLNHESDTIHNTNDNKLANDCTTSLAPRASTKMAGGGGGGGGGGGYSIMLSFASYLLVFTAILTVTLYKWISCIIIIIAE